MIFDIHYDDIENLYTIRDGRTGFLIAGPATAQSAMDSLRAMGHMAAADRIQSILERRADPNFSPEQTIQIAEPEDEQTARWRAEAEMLRDRRRAAAIEKFESGVPISDGKIQAIADEAEGGYDLDRLRRRSEKRGPIPADDGFDGDEWVPNAAAD